MKPRVAFLTLLLSIAALQGAAQNSGASVEVRGAYAPAPLPSRPGAIPDIEVAYRAFVSGELEVAERMLNDLVARRPSPAAFFLRGCTRYTHAMLVRVPGALSENARADIQKALAMNPSMWLDPRQFSPRLIAFIEEVRQAP